MSFIQSIIVAVFKLLGVPCTNQSLNLAFNQSTVISDIPQNTILSVVHYTNGYGSFVDGITHTNWYNQFIAD